MTKIELPSYLDQSDAVRDRFARLKQRPVILEVKGLQKEFETPQGRITALNDIHFKTYKREFVCVIGPSGCGKSTLIRILAGLENKSAPAVGHHWSPVSSLSISVYSLQAGYWMHAGRLID